MARARLTEEEMNPDLLTPGEVADILGVDPRTVTRWARRGLIAYIQTPGGHRRYKRAEIDRFTHERTTTDAQPE